MYLSPKEYQKKHSQIQKGKVEAFNFVNIEAEKVYSKILEILKEFDGKQVFLSTGPLAKKVSEKIYSITRAKREDNKFLRIWIDTGYSTSIYLNIDTTYKTGDCTVDYLKLYIYLGDRAGTQFKFSDYKPEFKQVDFEKIQSLKAEKEKLKKEYDEKDSAITKQIPAELRS